MSSAVIETNHGSIKINLLPELAPETVPSISATGESSCLLNMVMRYVSYPG